MICIICNTGGEIFNRQKVNETKMNSFLEKIEIANN